MPWRPNGLAELIAANRYAESAGRSRPLALPRASNRELDSASLSLANGAPHHLDREDSECRVGEFPAYGHSPTPHQPGHVVESSASEAIERLELRLQYLMTGHRGLEFALQMFAPRLVLAYPAQHVVRVTDVGSFGVTASAQKDEVVRPIRAAERVRDQVAPR
jgi:hypothetical protein